MSKKIIVLGATGHLGAYSAIHLKNSGYDVVAVGHRQSDNSFYKSKGIDYISGFCLEKADSFDILPKDADALVHLAGTMPAHADASPMPYINSIIIGMVNLCEWLKQTSCRRVIFNTTPSDVCAFFGTDVPVAEDAPRSFPKNGGDHGIYAIAKSAATDILEHYKYSDGISSCVFRHLTVYGYQPNPYYSLNGVRKMLPWRIIVEKAMKGDIVEVWGNPNAKKELLYIKDFAEAVRLAVESQTEGIVNLPGYQPYSMLEQVQGIVDVFSPYNNKSKIVMRPDLPSTPQNVLLMGKAMTEMGWEPKYNWISACEDIRHEMETEPFKTLWGSSTDFI